MRVGWSTTLPIKVECVAAYDFEPTRYVVLPNGRALVGVDGRETFKGLTGKYKEINFSLNETGKGSNGQAKAVFYTVAMHNVDSCLCDFESGLECAKDKMMRSLVEFGINPLDMYVEIEPKRN